MAKFFGKLGGIGGNIKDNLNKNLDNLKKAVTGQKEATITLPEVQKFIDENCPSRNPSEKLKSTIYELSLSFEKLKEKKSALANAELRNKEVEQRLIQIMEGNRLAYIKKLENFMHACKLPSSENIEEIRLFIDTYRNEIHELNETTAKSFYVLREFIGDETIQVASVLKQIDDKIITLIKVLEKEPIALLAGINDILSQLSILDEKKTDVNGRITIIEKEKCELIENLTETQKHIDALKSSESFSLFEQMNKEKEDLNIKINELHDGVLQSFSKINAALKKYEYYDKENKTVKSCLENCITFVEMMDDNDVRDLVSVLAKIRFRIEDGTIQIKDKKKEHILEAIDVLSIDYLSNIMKNLSDLRAKRSGINRVLLSQTVVREVSELEYKRDHIKSKIARTDEEIISLNKVSIKIDATKFMEKLSASLSELSSMKVTITAETPQQSIPLQNSQNVQTTQKDEPYHNLPQ